MFCRQIPELMFHVEELRGELFCFALFAFPLNIKHSLVGERTCACQLMPTLGVCINVANDSLFNPFTADSSVERGCCVDGSVALAKKYYQVLQRYYVQYMSGYDADVLNQLIQVSV